jgi:hypothetical protein
VALTQQSIDVRFTKTTAAQSLPACLTNASVDLSGTFCIADRKHRDWLDRRASRARALLRQHFLKRALFFSLCWCIRDAVHLDSRVHAANKPSTTSEGTMAKKAKKAKKAKSAVKKTAKKTRKVAKKKK